MVILPFDHQRLFRRSSITTQEFLAIHRCLRRRAELRQLIHWAQSKKLVGPRRLYKKRLMDEEERFAFYCIRFRHLIPWVIVFYNLTRILFRLSRRHVSSTASKYNGSW